MARPFSLERARVTLCSRDLARASAAATEIAAETGRVVAGEVADVWDASSLEQLLASQLLASAVASMGGLNRLICNAGGPPTGGFKAVT